MIRSVTALLASLILFTPLMAQWNIINVQSGAASTLEIAVDPQTHLDYGFAYPLTYEVSLPAGTTDLLAHYRHSSDESWTELEEKTADEFFNGLEVVRFDAAENKGYISVAFRSSSDSLFLKVTDNGGNNIAAVFDGISKYYDNRDAAVICTADDMAEWSRNKFNTAINILQDYKIWVSIGINTGGCNSSTYAFIQNQLNEGYVEAAAHSRSHPGPGVWNYYEEITLNKQEIIDNLTLPADFQNGNKEYVYTWIAPNGYTDAAIDSVLGMNQFLVNRLYYDGYSGFSDWDTQNGMYLPVGVTRAIDPPRSRLGWGIGSDDSLYLNAGFDEAVAAGEVYHFLMHPNVVEWDSAYVWSHLDHVSNHKNIWYAATGQVFAYHLAQDNYVVPTAIAEQPEQLADGFALAQNYPNPFNPATNIEYRIASSEFVTLKIYDIRGRLVKTLVNENHSPGSYRVQWDGRDQSGESVVSGFYFYRIQAGEFTDAKKFTLLR